MIKNISCRRQHLKQDFPQRFLAKQPQKIHLTSDDHTKRRGGIHIQPLQPYHKKILIYFTVVANIRINTKKCTTHSALFNIICTMHSAFFLIMSEISETLVLRKNPRTTGEHGVFRL